MRHDLKKIETTNEWKLDILDDDEIKLLPEIDKLIEARSGTIVIWEKFDKIEESSKSFKDSFIATIGLAKQHIEFVFHRFYDKINFEFNGHKIEKRDPFLSGYTNSQEGRTQEILIDGNKIVVTPFVLPYANSLNEEQKKMLGNPKSIYDEQGFYLYRNERLISWGSWMRMGIRSELNKLARIQVDIPSTLDSVWMLDVKKSSAKIPDKIKDRIKMAVEDSIVRSKRTTKFPGVKEQSATCKMWDRINEHEGKVRYQINRSAPAILALYDAIGETEKELLEIALSQIEAYLPKYSIANDNMDALNIVNSATDMEEERLIEEIEKIVAIFDPAIQRAQFENIFMAESYQRLFKRKDEIKRRIFGDE
jgi:hypothetical protein